MSDWKHRVRDLINKFGVDLVPISHSPISVIHSLKDMNIRTVIDVGANEGQYARRALRQFPNAAIFSFEPLPGPYKKLSSWAESHSRVNAFQVALGDKETNLKINMHVDHSPSSSFLETSKEASNMFKRLRRQSAVEVRQTTLDSAIKEFDINLSPEVLVKMDVQGYEDRVVRGARNTIRKAKACLLEIGLIEIYRKQATFADLVAEMKKHGMRFAGTSNQVHDSTGRALYMDALFVRE